MAGFSEREGYVRLVMTRADYDLLTALCGAGFLNLSEHGGLRAALPAMELMKRMTEGDPGIGKTFPDLGKAILEARVKVRMLDVLEEMAERAFAREPETVQ